MRAVVQCVSEASVTVEGRAVGAIGRGYAILLGVGHGDTEAEAERLWRKVAKMRVFEDAQGKTNLSLADVGGEVLVVSQFSCTRTACQENRPSFTDAAEPAIAQRLYEHFADLARADGFTVATGEFGAMMDVALVNHGPFTVVLVSTRFSGGCPR